MILVARVVLRPVIQQHLNHRFVSRVRSQVQRCTAFTVPCIDICIVGHE